MGSRLDSGRCLGCGNVLIELAPELQMCSTCQEKVNALAQKAIKNRKKNKKESDGLKRKRFTMKVGILK